MNGNDLASVGKGAALNLAGIFLAAAIDLATTGALGPRALAIAVAITPLLNLARKWFFPSDPVPPPPPGPDGPTPPNPPAPGPDARPEGVLVRLLDALRARLAKNPPPAPDAPKPPDPSPPSPPWAAALLAALLLGGSAMAEVKIQGETKVPAYRIVRLSAAGDVDGAALVWDVDREDAADMLEVGGVLLLTGPPGTYKVKLRAFRTRDGKMSAETARATVVIGDAPPTPPGPGPVPPGPVPPGPESQLVKELKLAYAADTGAEKAKHLASLAAVYREVSAKTNAPEVKTAGDLLGVLRAAVGSLVPADALTALRKRIAVEVSASLPSDPAVALDTTTRQKASEVFTRVAQALEVTAR